MTNYAAHGDIIMCLAHLLDNKDDPQYTEVMTRLSAKKHAMLDNGANEGQPFTGEALIEASYHISAKEMVLPDVLGDADLTWAASLDFMKNHAKHSGTNFIGVAQGENDTQLHKLIDLYAQEDSIKVIGVPRLLLKQYVSARIDLANWIDSMYRGRFHVHLLGASALWLKEPLYVSKYAPHVRSIDTSLPFNYGIKGVCIDAADGVVINRPDEYFTKWYAMTERTTIMHNIMVYKEWCNGKTAPAGKLS